MKPQPTAGLERTIATVMSIGIQDMSVCSLWIYYQTAFLFVGIRWACDGDPALEKSHTETPLLSLLPKAVGTGGEL